MEKKKSEVRKEKRSISTAFTTSGPGASSKRSLRNENDLEVLKGEGLTRKTKKPMIVSSKLPQNLTFDEGLQKLMNVKAHMFQKKIGPQNWFTNKSIGRLIHDDD
ncbi:hypothetical protein Fot_14595 [Forsythia ovata]|uniref:Uncharacterized protein n=1 Tax=Forsythia ovata TaxID=205694 RepID=A0ABD1W725_9LAMI